MLFHLKILLRKLRLDGLYSFINIGGLTIGMAATMIIMLWVYNQWSYDRFHTKAKQIHQVWSRQEKGGQIECWQSTSLLIGPTLKDEYPEIVESVRVADWSNYFFGEGDRHLTMKNMFTDPSFLTVFSFPLLKGDVNTALNEMYSVILTEKAALRLFGEEEPMGKTLMFDMKHPMTITGVMKDLPNNTRFDFETLVNIQFFEMIVGYSTSWGNHGPKTYVEVTPLAQIDQLNAVISNLIKNRTDNDVPTEPFLYPLDKSWLHNKFENGVPSGGSITFLRMFTIIAIFILLIACINFVNLSTAMATMQTMNVGLRKTFGSRRAGLIRLFLSETMILAFISGILAFIIVHSALPYFSGWLGGFGGKVLLLDFLNIRFWLFALAFIIITGFLAGSYPALYLSAISPVKVLKGAVSVAGSRVSLRKVLVVLQFSFAIFLMIGSMVVSRQITHAQNRNAGYDKELLIHIPLPEGIANHYTAFRHDLMSSGAVKDMTKALAPMMDMWAQTFSPFWRGKEDDDRRSFDLYFTDSNWTEMMGVELVAGRFPNPAIWTTDSSAILISEAAAKIIGFDDPIGEKLMYWGYEGYITGVFKDFVLHSPFEKPAPVVIGSEKLGGERSALYIRLMPGKTADKLAIIENIYKQYSSGYPFQYKFADDDYAIRFKDVQAIESLTGFFTIIAILISCMGLFALVSFTAERRKKEIGIRKVMGASVINIVLLLGKEYLLLTVIAFVVAAPLAWFVMQKFLNIFDYRTNIPLWLIVLVGIFILLISLITVCSKAIKAAMGNPVNAIMNF